MLQSRIIIGWNPCRQLQRGCWVPWGWQPWIQRTGHTGNKILRNYSSDSWAFRYNLKWDCTDYKHTCTLYITCCVLIINVPYKAAQLHHFHQSLIQSSQTNKSKVKRIIMQAGDLDSGSYGGITDVCKNHYCSLSFMKL